MSYLDVKYIQYLSPRLPLFKKKKADLFNFRCPYCGDSQRRKNKARGYLFKIKNEFVYKCHNCGYGRTFSNFLKDQDTMLHDRYIMEKFRDGKTGKGTTTPNPKFNFTQPKFKKKDIDLDKISDLNTSHTARKYLQDRKIKDLSQFYYAPKFKAWTNELKQTFDSLRGDDSRIIIPFRDKDGKLFGYQGRSLAKTATLRYITVMLDEDRPKIFGLDRIDDTKPIYITEGPFDATFIQNSVAMAGSDVDIRTFGWRNYIYVYDNEPRNTEIVNRISKSIDGGGKVVIWPKNIQQKDINDMYLAGHDVQKVVESNSYSGLEATLKLNDWKKV